MRIRLLREYLTVVRAPALDGFKIGGSSKVNIGLGPLRLMISGARNANQDQRGK